MQTGILVLLMLSVPAAAVQAQRATDDIAKARLGLMRDRALGIRFQGKESFPQRLESKPLFRYDDLTRGYVDGTVWKLGKTGRPLAVVTTELHPRYGMHGTNRSNPRVVYELLAVSASRFSAKSDDLSWSPLKSAVTMKDVKRAPRPAEFKAKRLVQMRQLARRFKAIQEVTNEGSSESQHLVLRLLPQNIDRYSPTEDAKSDGAMFLFVAGRMPGIILLLETDGQRWQFGVGRLSAPSTLVVSLDTQPVWTVPRNFGGSSDSYYALNAVATIPGE